MVLIMVAINLYCTLQNVMTSPLWYISLDNYFYHDNFYYYDYEDHDGLSGGAIAGISVGSFVLLVIIITSLIVTLVCVRYHCKKQQNRRVHGVTNSSTIMTNKSAPSYPSLPPVYISTQPTAAVFYKNVSTDFGDAESESLPEYAPSNPPPEYASIGVANAAQNIVQWFDHVVLSYTPFLYSILLLAALTTALG